MKILVVDDEKIVADTTGLVFRSAGHETLVMYSAEQALAACSNFQPDLLLTDVAMAGINGIDLSIRISMELPSCKVLLISGQPQVAELLEDARRRGYRFEIIAKPILPDELLAKAMEMTRKL